MVWVWWKIVYERLDNIARCLLVNTFQSFVRHGVRNLVAACREVPLARGIRSRVVHTAVNGKEKKAIA